MDKDAGDDSAWWDEITPLWIFQNSESDVEQDYWFVHYMVEHPNYDAGYDEDLKQAGYDPVSMDAYFSIYKLRAAAYLMSYSSNALGEYANFYSTYGAAAVVGGFVLSGGFSVNLRNLNERLGIRMDYNRMRSPGSFISYTRQIENRMQKDRSLVLTVDEANDLVELSRSFGTDIELNGPGHKDPNWEMTHLHFGKERIHIRVPDDYNIPPMP